MQFGLTIPLQRFLHINRTLQHALFFAVLHRCSTAATKSIASVPVMQLPCYKARKSKVPRVCRTQQRGRQIRKCFRYLCQCFAGYKKCSVIYRK